MNRALDRRLATLEAAMNPGFDLAAALDTMRAHRVWLPEEESRAEVLADARSRLAEMEARHAERPVQGVWLRLLEAQRRMVTHCEAEMAA